MNITIYTNTVPLNHINRSLTQIASLNGTLKEGCDILSPDVTVEYNSSYIGANYAYIPDFSRYYYFRQPPTIEGKTMVLHLYADSLYNFRNVILASPCIAERSSSHFNNYLPDSAVLEEEGYYYSTGVLPYEFKPNNGSYLLTVCGGN